MTIPAIAPYIFERQGWLEDTLRDGGALTGPFTILVGLLIAFRLGDAYKKWDLGTRCLTDLHSSANLVTSMLCCYVVKDDFTAEALKNIRRLMILACVSIARAIRSQKELDMEQQLGLITEQEVYELTEKKMSFSVDGKTDRYPTRNRPQAIFFRLSYEVAELWRKKHIPSPNHHLSIENEIKKMARVCEEVEHLNMTILPLPYAQLTRLVTFLLLIILPYASVGDVDFLCIPLSFIANLVFFTVDECSSQMETPFGDDTSDIDLPKLLRRIDKHSAATLAMWLGAPVQHFNLYPEAQTTVCPRFFGRGMTFCGRGANGASANVSELATTGGGVAQPIALRRKKSVKLYETKPQKEEKQTIRKRFSVCMPSATNDLRAARKGSVPPGIIDLGGAPAAPSCPPSPPVGTPSVATISHSDSPAKAGRMAIQRVRSDNSKPDSKSDSGGGVSPGDGGASTASDGIPDDERGRLRGSSSPVARRVAPASCACVEEEASLRTNVRVFDTEGRAVGASTDSSSVPKAIPVNATCWERDV